MTYNVYKFTVPGNPVGKGRPRLSRGVIYTPRETSDYESWIVHNFKYQYPRVLPSTQCISLTIIATYHTPKKTKHIEPRGKGYPDLDNVIKIVMDALNGVAYGDDSQVVCIYSHKRYSEESQLEIEIREVESLCQSGNKTTTQ